MKYYFDTNSDGYLSKKERNNAALISAKYWKISSFKGIKYFPNLKYLDCGHNNLTSLDLLGNKKLESRLESVRKSRLLLDRVNEALSVLKKKPDNGAKMYELIYLTYLAPV